jgi:rare lipoprotein A
MKNSFQLHKNRNQMNTFLRGCLLFTGLLLHLSAAAQWTWQETGNASYYADKFHGRSTASGERYNKNELTAAHRTLPMGSIVRVTHARNGQSVEVRINDCGPHNSERVIDLSRAAAEEIQLIADGVAPVILALVEPGEGHCACDRKKQWDPSPWKAKEVVLAIETEEVVAPQPEPTQTTLPEENKQPKPIAETAPVSPTPQEPPTTEEPPTKQESPSTQEPPTPQESPTKQEPPSTQESRTPQESPTKQEPPSTQESPSTGIVLQLGAFGNKDNANNFIQKINNQGFSNLFVKEFSQGEKTLYRVYLGVFLSKTEAETAQKELKEKAGIEGVVTELK